MKKTVKNINHLKINMLSSVGNSVFNWFVILRDNNFKIGIKYIPRALFVTFMTLFQQPIILLEKFIFDRRIKKTKLVSPVFIIGHMRSGTTFLHYLLSRDDQFACVTTTETIFPWVFLTLKKPLKRVMNFFLPNKRPMDNMEMNEDLPQEEEFAIANLCPYSPNNGAYFPTHLKEFYYKYSLFQGVNERIINTWKKTYTYFLKKISFKNKGKRVLSKSLVNSSRINHLIKMYPDAKFIFIYRNPYKVYLSTKKLYQKFILQYMTFHDIDERELEDSILELAEAGFRKYLDDRQLLNENNLYEVKFEDFVQNPIYYLEDIYSRLNIVGFENAKGKLLKFADKYKDYKPDKYHIDETLKNKIYNKLEFIFKNFGYNK